MQTQPDEMLGVFLDESAENLAALEEGLLKLDRDPTDRTPLDRVFRAAHSIKGGSSFFGIEAVTRLAHALENVLDQIRSGKAQSTRRKVDILLRSADRLGRFLAETRDGRCPQSGHEALVRELEAVAGDNADANPSDSRAVHAPALPTISGTKPGTTEVPVAPPPRGDALGMLGVLTEYAAALEALSMWTAHTPNQ